MATPSEGELRNQGLPTPSAQQEGPGAFVMFEDEIDLEDFYGMPTAAAFGVLMQIITSSGKVSTTHDLLECFSDGIHDLSRAVSELQMLGFLDVNAIEVEGLPTVKLDITFLGHTYLSMFAWELIENYQSYYRD